MRARRFTAVLGLPVIFLAATMDSTAIADEFPNARRPTNDVEARYWLTNMIVHHRFTVDEVRAATGYSAEEIREAVRRWRIDEENLKPRSAGEALRVLPYPGGRHPRIGFLEGAIDPQRETKISVFTPWSPHDYVVADIPEAIWSNLGLTYLAHTHVPTLWSQQNIELERLEWNRRDDGSYDIQRRLPNGIAFGVKVAPEAQGVRMRMWLKNGTDEPLSDLRVQNCVMLKGADGFATQTNENKVLRAPYTACRSAGGDRWVISAWSPCHRAWANQRCPCLHSDPKFPDCPPGATREVRGWLSFYEGDDIQAEFDRIAGLNWDADR